MQVGYALSSEEHAAADLVSFAARAEGVGFDILAISDHFHPWTDRQGQSPMVWPVLGGIAQVTERVRVGTRVTCPIMRLHPAIVAQASGTVATMMPDRFFLGLGTGEYLNEHVFGQTWPRPTVRREMLEEAVELIRKLWTGRLVSHRKRHYTVESARLYSIPEEPPPIAVAMGGPKSARLAGRIGDAVIGVSPDRQLLETAKGEAEDSLPSYGELHVCWAPTEGEARRTAHEWWPVAAFKGPLGSDLALPSHFEDVAQMVNEEDVAEAVTCGPDPERHIAAIKEFDEAGFDAVWVHQIGTDQVGFFEFYEKEILPLFR